MLVGGVGLSLNLLDRFRGQLKDPSTVLFVAVHAAPCLSVLSTAWVDCVVVCLWIAFEKRWQCGDKSNACTFVDLSVLAEGGSGCKVLCAKLMSGGMPGLPCATAASSEPGLLAEQSFGRVVWPSRASCSYDTTSPPL